MPRPQPQPGRPIARQGKPYLYMTWLAKLLGGNECRWAVWFRAHFQHAKFETMGEQLAAWNREHTALMRQVREELEANGWTCRVEQENELRIELPIAILAGKPDLVATMPGHALVVDGKTGRRRDSDWWQVLLYLRGLQLSDPQSTATLLGEVRYKDGGVVTVDPLAIDGVRDQVVQAIKVVAGSTPPAKAPSRYECQHCNIGPRDCPERWADETAVTTAAAAGF